MPVKVYKRKGTYRGKRFSYVTADSAKGSAKSHHTNRSDASASARIRNAAIRRKRK